MNVQILTINSSDPRAQNIYFRLQFLSSMSYNFQCIDLSLTWLNFFLGSLFFYMQLYMRFFFKLLFLVVSYYCIKMQIIFIY